MPPFRLPGRDSGPGRCTALLALLAVLLAAASPAQEIPEKRRPGHRSRLELPDRPLRPVRPRQDPGAPSPAADEEEPEAAPASWWDGQEIAGAERIVQVFRDFEGLPDPDPAQRRAALERLQAFGLRTRPVALRALECPHLPSVLLAAKLLEAVGEPEDAPRLVDLASGLGYVEGAVACLETSLRLNGGWMPHRAVRLLEHPEKKLRIAAEARLLKGLREEHLKPLLQVLRFGRDSDARLRAARLLARAREDWPEDEELRRGLREVLRGAPVSVAFVAAEALAGRPAPGDCAWLREELERTEAEDELAWFLYARLLQQDRSEELLVDDALVERLIPLLDRSDPFLAGAAAALLAEYEFRSDAETGLVALERPILHRLVRAVGGAEFYPQYARFSPVAEESLKRFTGEDFGGEDRSAWLAWMVENIDTFRAVRGTLHVGLEEAPRLMVRWSRAGGPERILAGPEAEDPPPGARLLGPRSLERVLGILEEARLLGTRILPGTYGPDGEPLRSRLEIAVGDRRKRLAFRGPAGLDWVPDLLARLDSLHAETSWQSLAHGPGARDFILARLESWDAAGAAERLRMKVEMTRGQVEGLSDEVLDAWCRELVADPGIARHWEPALARELLEHLPARQHAPDTARALLKAALLVPDPGLAGPLLARTEDLDEPLRSELVQAGLERLGTEAAVGALQDPRLHVRVAAVRALRRGGSEAVAALEGALGDENPLVVRMALRSLGEIADPGVLGAVLNHAGPGFPREVRKEALWALGRLGVSSPGVLGVFRDAARDGDAGVRLAAVDGLGNLPGEAVQDLFRELFPAFAATPLEVSFLRVLERRGAGSTRRVLRAHLDSQDSGVARRAALQAGRLGDPAAAPRLMALLPEMPRDPELLDALTFTLCTDFRHTPDPAGVYESWWRENQGVSPAEWLRRSASERGLVLPERFADPREEETALAVPALLDLLENGPSFLRPATSYWLERLTGVDAPALYGSSPRPLVQEVARVWHDWLKGRDRG